MAGRRLSGNVFLSPSADTPGVAAKARDALVEQMGFEPTTSALRTQRSPN